MLAVPPEVRTWDPPGPPLYTALVSRTVQSTDLFGPYGEPRVTQDSIAEYQQAVPSLGGKYWGEKLTEYGGIGGFPFLGTQKVRDLYVSRSHRHFGSGVTKAATYDQPYQLTDLSKSGCRINDERLRAPMKTNLERIPRERVNWPGNHSYYSHKPIFDVFPDVRPKYESDSVLKNKGRESRETQVTNSYDDALRRLHQKLFHTSLYQDSYKGHSNTKSTPASFTHPNALQLRPEPPNSSFWKPLNDESPAMSEIEGGDGNEEDDEGKGVEDDDEDDVEKDGEEECERDERGDDNQKGDENDDDEVKMKLSNPKNGEDDGENEGKEDDGDDKKNGEENEGEKKKEEEEEDGDDESEESGSQFESSGPRSILITESSKSANSSRSTKGGKSAKSNSSGAKRSVSFSETAQVKILESREGGDGMESVKEEANGDALSSPPSTSSTASKPLIAGTGPCWPPSTSLVIENIRGSQLLERRDIAEQQVRPHALTSSGKIDPLKNMLSSAKIGEHIGLPLLRSRPAGVPSVKLPSVPLPSSLMSQSPSLSRLQGIKEGAANKDEMNLVTSGDELFMHPLEQAHAQMNNQEKNQPFIVPTSYFAQNRNKSSIIFGTELPKLRDHSGTRKLQDELARRVAMRKAAGSGPLVLPPAPLSDCLTPSGSKTPHRLGLRFKTEAHKRYHAMHPEHTPDLRSANNSGRKCFFNGDHSSVYRG